MKEIRLARISDAEQLFVLNENFNGRAVTTLDTLKNKLSDAKGEIVVVCEKEGAIVGFVCVQIFQSFCYVDNYAEITEVFVETKHRKRGYATQMIEFAQDYCQRNFGIKSFQLFTSKYNSKAKKLYKSLGYRIDDVVLFRRRG